MSILPQMICIANVIPFKILIEISCWQAFSKIKISRGTKAFFKKENKVEKRSLLSNKTYFKVVVIKLCDTYVRTD